MLGLKDFFYTQFLPLRVSATGKDLYNNEKKNVLPPLTFRFFQANLKKQHKSRKKGNKKTHLRIYASRYNVLPKFSGSKVYKVFAAGRASFTKLMKVEGTHQQMHHFTHRLAEHINNCKERSEQEPTA